MIDPVVNLQLTSRLPQNSGDNSSVTFTHGDVPVLSEFNTDTFPSPIQYAIPVQLIVKWRNGAVAAREPSLVAAHLAPSKVSKILQPLITARHGQPTPYTKSIMDSKNYTQSYLPHLHVSCTYQSKHKQYQPPSAHTNMLFEFFCSL